MASERKMLFEKQFKDAFLHKKEESLDRKIKEFVIDSRIEQIFIEEINQSTVSKNNFFFNELEKSALKRFAKTTKIFSDSLKIAKTFNENKINYVFLKGLYLVNCSYPKKSMRPINDIDVLVHDDDLMKSIDLAKKVGFTEQRVNSLTTKNKYHVPPLFTKDNFSRLEIHHSIFPKNEKIVQNQIFDSKINLELNGTLVSLNAEYNLLHLIFHGTSKGYFDVGIQYLFDIRYLCETHDIDWDLFQKITIEFGLSKEVCLTKYLLIRIFEKDYICFNGFGIPQEYLDHAINLIFDTKLNPAIYDAVNPKKTFQIIKKSVFLNKSASINESIKRFFMLFKRHSFKILKVIAFGEDKNLIRSKNVIREYFDGN